MSPGFLCIIHPFGRLLTFVVYDRIMVMTETSDDTYVPFEEWLNTPVRPSNDTERK